MVYSKNSLLLIIDIQEKFRPVLSNVEELTSNVIKLVKVFQLLQIPILVSEQYPQGLGETMIEIKDELEKHDNIKKVSFDCFLNSDFVDLVENKFSDKKQLIICGIEAHICVTQTVLSALSRGYEVYLIANAVSSRKKVDYDIALKRMVQEGAKLSSVEMICFQMLTDSNHEHFKKISKIIK